MSKVTRTGDLLNEYGVYINTVDIDLIKQANITSLQFHAVIPRSYTFSYLERVNAILGYSDLFTRLTFSSELTGRVFVPYQVIPPISQIEFNDADYDLVPDEQEIQGGTNPEDETDFTVSFFNIFNFL